MAGIRSPILVAVGHVDHGKTTLLDKIRGTAMVKTEPGLITQYISASFVPIKVIRDVCGEMIIKMKIELTIPGLLLIDTPGHEAFTTLRKRGGAIADLAILVIDMHEGFKPQTAESLDYLKQFRTPFVVAMTKIDRLMGWQPQNDACFLDSFAGQPQRVQEELDEKLYRLVGQLSEKGFEAERFDRITDFGKQIAIIPVSGKTGEGIPELLVMLAGLAQRFLRKSLEITPGEGKGAVLEVKEFKGLGTTIDVVLYDGEIARGDFIIIGGKEPVVARVKALMEPEPLKELRIEKNFCQVEQLTAAAAMKVSAPGLEGVIAGSPFRAVRNEKDVEKARQEVQEEIEEVEIETDKDGVVVKADTLGSLEAMIKILMGKSIPIKKAHVGDLTKSDVMELRAFKDQVVFAFGVKIQPDIEQLAKENKVWVFHSDVIYRILEDYQKWLDDAKKREEQELLDSVTRPGRVRILPGYVFRQMKPAVFGVEVVKGTIKPGYRLHRKGKVVGEIKEIQSQGNNQNQAKSGDRVALSVQDMVVGKDANEGEELDVYLTGEALRLLEKIRHKLRPDEVELLGEGE
ncbi:MAG: translation initiation factor IF-2 [Candidatus Aenigmarchaeota archaeon]|nr:translation initiation factor IF-2 [Candidatus Aenigmarchaeota archaeon]